MESVDFNNVITYGIADLILSIGHDDFFEKLTYLLKTTASFDDYVILIYHPTQSPTVVASSFAMEELSAWKRYLAGAYLLSPFYDFSVNQGKQGFVTLDEIAPEDFYQSTYYQDYFHHSKLVDETCFCVQGQNDNVYLLSLGRTQTLAKFSERVLMKLQDLYPIFSSAVKRHDLTQTLPERDSSTQVKDYIQSFGENILTERERQVTQLMIRGYSSKEAARILDISYETDRVHRKNIYNKLQVKSQNELLAKIFDDIVNLGYE